MMQFKLHFDDLLTEEECESTFGSESTDMSRQVNEKWEKDFEKAYPQFIESDVEPLHDFIEVETPKPVYLKPEPKITNKRTRKAE